MEKIKTLKFSELENLLEGIQKPGRYVNHEVGTKSKDISKIADFSSMVFMALIFPDIYEIGMPNLGLPILYEIINKIKYFSAERVFSPWIDFEKKLRDRKVKLFSLENRIFLDCFDVLGFSVQHEMLCTNILNIIDMSGLKIHSKERGGRFPLVCAGGPAVVNPQPLSKFMDFMVIGDGEELTIKILEKVKTYKKSSKGKLWFLKEISKLDGVYVPGLYKFYYFKDGKISDIKPFLKVKKETVKDLNKFDIVLNPVIPNIKPVHDRFAVEIMRGCSRGCRFCQAGIIYRPVRQRNVNSLIENSICGIKNTGYDEISFMSLSTADYKDIGCLLEGVAGFMNLNKISVSLPSLRVDSFNLHLAELIGSGRRTGLTFAPEAGSQRMRDIINKDISEEEIIDCIKVAFKNGWEKIKLYFMIGFPFEEDEDIEQIVLLIKKITNTAKDALPKRNFRRFKINVSINAFCPKPFTPFQWVGQDSTGSLVKKFNYIVKNVPKKFVQISWSNPQASKIESALSKGDSSVGDAIEKAWRKGAKFDNWTDMFSYKIWEEAFKESGLDINFFATREILPDEILPWDIIDIGTSKKFLFNEYEKSRKCSRVQNKI